MYSTSSHCISSAYACIAAQMEVSPVLLVLFVLFMVVILSTTFIFDIWREYKQNEEETISEVNPDDQIKIDILNQVSLHVHPLGKTHQVLETSSGLGDLSPGTNEVHQTTSQIATDESGATSQLTLSEQPPIPTASTENEAQVPDLKTEFKVATWALLFSGGGIFSVLSGLLGNGGTDITHKVLFRAFTSLNYISLVSAVVLFLLTFGRSNMKCLVMIVKITMWITIGSITYALSCATSIILSHSLVGVVLILVFPLLVVFLVFILRFSSRRN